MPGQSNTIGEIVEYDALTYEISEVRADGSVVDQAKYKELYDVIGPNYNVSPRNIKNGQPWNQQFDLNVDQYDPISSWEFDSTLPKFLNNFKVLVTNKIVYLLGGKSQTVSVNTIYYTLIDENGKLGKWTLSESILPISAYNFNLVVVANTAYIIGGVIDMGINGDGSITELNSVYSAQITDSGILGGWSLVSTLPTTVYNSQVVVTNKMMYIIGGGIDGSPESDIVITATVDSNGILGTWGSASVSLPVVVKDHGVAVIGDRIYLFGGSVSNDPTSDVYYAIPETDGSITVWNNNWSSLPKALSKIQTIVTQNAVYLVGGFDNTGPSASVYSATFLYNYDFTVNDNDVIWNYNQPLREPLGDIPLMVTSTKVYTLGGNNSNSFSSVINSSPFIGGVDNYMSSFRNEVEGGGNTGTITIPVHGQPWKQQSLFNTTVNISGRHWTQGPSLPEFMKSYATIVLSNTAYIIGGITSDGFNNYVYSAPIDASGVLGDFVLDGNRLPGAFYGGNAIVTFSHVYVFGGNSNQVYKAAINSNNTLEPWTISTPLPFTSVFSQSVVIGGYVYIFGGDIDGDISNAVYSAPVVSGVIGTWTLTSTLPIPLSKSELIVIDDKVYLLGGWTTGQVPVNDICSALLNPNTGLLDGWAIDYHMPTTFVDGVAVVIADSIYAISGSDAVAQPMYKAKINIDKTLGAWTLDSSIPMVLFGSSILVTSSRMYVIGTTGYSTEYFGYFQTQSYYSQFDGGLNDYIIVKPVPGYVGKPWQDQYEFNNNTAISPSIMNINVAPWNDQYSFNIAQSGDITGWTTEADVLPQAITFSRVVVTKNYVHILGGYSGFTAFSDIFRAPINPDGTLGSWTTLSYALPLPYMYGKSFVTKSRVYIVEGYTVYSCPINSDGTLGTWTQDADFPYHYGHGCFAVIKNKVYSLGGVVLGATYTDSVYVANIDDNGAIGAWVLSGNSLYEPGAYVAPILTKDRIYLFGGNIAAGQTNKVYTAVIDVYGNIGSWSVHGTMPRNAYHHQVVTTKNTVYVLGGSTSNGVVTNSIIYANIDSDGIVGSWMSGTNMPFAMGIFLTVITSSKLYLLGGWPWGVAINTIYSADFLGGHNNYLPDLVSVATDRPFNGLPWKIQNDFNNTQSGDITGWTTDTVFPATIAKAETLIIKNKVYILGGFIGGVASYDMYCADIDVNGVIGTWSTVGTVPTGCVTTQHFITSSRVYILSKLTTPEVYYAVINSDGTLGSWVQDNNLPDALQAGLVVTTYNRVYLLGGISGGIDRAWVFTASIDSNGVVSSWSRTADLFDTLSYSQAIVTSSRVYITSGIQGGSQSNQTYYAPINSDGTIGAWVSGPSLPRSIAYSQSVVVNKTAYIISGQSGDATSVYRGNISSGGVIASWVVCSAFPTARLFSTPVITSSRIYLIGGGASASPPYSNVIYHAPFAGGYNDYSNKIIGDSKAYNAITSWSTLTAKLNVALLDSQAVVTNDYLYLIGGHNGAYAPGQVNVAPINTAGTLGTFSAYNNLQTSCKLSQVVMTSSRIYVIGGVSSVNDSPTNIVQYATINVDGSLGPWVVDTPLPDSIYAAQSVITTDRIYVLGGINISQGQTAVYTAPIDVNGVIGAWVAGTSLPIVIAYTQAIKVKDLVYLIGGVSSGGDINTIYSASINLNGTLGSWTLSGNLPFNISQAQIVSTHNRVYILGGIVNGVRSNTIYDAPINSDGSLGGWIVSTVLPAAINKSTAAITKDHLYLLGGLLTGSTATTDVYVGSFVGGANSYATTQAVIGYTGQPWKSQYEFNTSQSSALVNWDTLINKLNLSTHAACSLVTKNYIYLIGGHDGSSTYREVNGAPINSDGTLGTWVHDSNLPVPAAYQQVLMTKSRVYVFGGYNGAALDTVQYAPINSNGTLGAWVVGTSLPTPVYSAGAVITINKAYILGGYDNTAATDIVYVAPIDEDGVIGVWTTSDPLPIEVARHSVVEIKNKVFLIGGVDGFNTQLSTVYWAPIDNNGLIGGWSLHDPLPTTHHSNSIVVTKNEIYLMGGYASGAETNVSRRAPIDNNGMIGTWETNLSLPSQLAFSAVAVTKDNIYILGGAFFGSVTRNVFTNPFSGGSNSYFSDTVQPDIEVIEPYDPWRNQFGFNLALNDSYTKWSYVGVFQFPVNAAQSVATNKKVFIIGGYDPTTIGNSVLMLDINKDGYLVDNVIVKTDLPDNIALSQAFITNTRIYVVGGLNDTQDLIAYYALINLNAEPDTWIACDPLPIVVWDSQSADVNGRIYMFGGLTPSGATANVYYSVVATDGSLGVWTAATSLPIVLYASSVAVTNSRVYLIGGRSTEGYVSSVYYAPINLDGTLGAWVAGTSLPTSIANAQVVVTSTRAYLMGGRNSSGGLVSVYTAPIDVNGVIGTWVFDIDLPLGWYYSCSAITTKAIYLIGRPGTHTGDSTGGDAIFCSYLPGGRDNYLNLTHDITITIAEITVAKAGQPWNQQYFFNKLLASNMVFEAEELILPDPCCQSQIIVTNNKVYILGGRTDVNAISSSVYSATIDNNGILSEWAEFGNIPASLCATRALITKSHLYLIGGYDGTDVYDFVYSAPLDTDGVIGTWTENSHLPETVMNSQVAVIKNKMYVIGGNTDNDTLYTDVIYCANIDTEGAIGTWVDVGSIGLQLCSALVVVTNTKLYLIGGSLKLSDNTTIVTTDRIISAPINGNGTLGAWVTETPFPIPIKGAQVVVTKHYVFIFGGSSTALYRASIATDDTLGEWILVSNSLVARKDSHVIVTSSKVYMLGGINSSDVILRTIVSAPFTGGLNNYSHIVSNNVVVPDTFSLPSFGKAWRHQYSENTKQGNAIVMWKEGPSVYEPISLSSAFITKNKAYLIGGRNTNGYTSSIRYADINQYGILSDWYDYDPMLIPIAGAQLVYVKNHLYLIGGINSDGVSNKVYHTTVLPNGELNVWTEQQYTLPEGVTGAQAIVTNYVSDVSTGRIYLIGGSDSDGYPVKTVYWTSIDETGVIGEWNVGTDLLNALVGFNAVIVANKVYLIGGHDGVKVTNDIYAANINIDGTLGAWYFSGYTVAEHNGAQVAVTANAVYILGGYDNKSSPTIDCYYATVDVSGKLSNWMLCEALPVGLADSQVLITYSSIYIISGQGISALSSYTYYAPFRGGSNDYISLVPNVRANVNTQFTLPNLSEYDDTNNKFSYITVS